LCTIKLHKLSEDFDKSPATNVNTNGSILSSKNELPDPFQLVRDDMISITESIKRILGSDHPVLSAVAKYFFENDGGKKIRPTMVLLISNAAEEHRRVNISPDKPLEQNPEFIAAAQQRLAEIT
jgi:geranylgeranyl pyrophosphate synthase